jgi:phosphatidylglycerophosphatase A
MAKNKINFDFHFLIATWFGMGKSKIMPGTVGSLGAFPVWFLLNNLILNFSNSKIFFYSFWMGFLVFFIFFRSKIFNNL